MELFKKVHQTTAGLGRGVRGGMCDRDRMVHRLFRLRGSFGHHGWLCGLCRRQRRRLRRGLGASAAGAGVSTGAARTGSGRAGVSSGTSSRAVQSFFSRSYIPSAVDECFVRGGFDLLVAAVRLHLAGIDVVPQLKLQDLAELPDENGVLHPDAHLHAHSVLRMRKSPEAM